MYVSGDLLMVDGDEFYVTLFSALVGELSKTRKQWLVMRVAEILIARATASPDISRAPSAKEAAAIAARLIHNMTSCGRTPPSRPSVGALPSALTKRQNPLSVADHDKKIEAAKQAIRLKFESWRAVKPHGHWHVVFARKMIQEHACIGEQRIIEKWVRAWDKQVRQHTTQAIDTPHVQSSGINTATHTTAQILKSRVTRQAILSNNAETAKR